MSFHANRTRSGSSAKFPCHSAADAVFAPEIPLPAGWQNLIKILICMMFLITREAFQGLGKKLSLLSGRPGAFDRGDPGLECGAQLGEAVVLGDGTLDDGVADHRSARPDRDRKGVAGPTRLRLLAALGRCKLGQDHPCSLEVALDV